MTMQGQVAPARQPGRLAVLAREFRTVMAATIAVFLVYIVLKVVVPAAASNELTEFLRRYVGLAWPFFFVVTVFLFYVAGAWMVEVFGLGIARRWDGISQILTWATEACPLVGLLTTFLSFLVALTTYADAGPASPETQSVFIAQFAIAFGSSIAGGVLALLAFTFYRLIPGPEEDRAT